MFRRAMAVAVLLMAVPVCAQAQTEAPQGGSAAGQMRSGAKFVVPGVLDVTDSTVYATPGTASGANVTETSPARDANLTFQDIINNFGASALAIGAADSSAVLDTHDIRLGMLLIKAVIAGTGTVDTTVRVRLAFSIRTHLGGVDDSMSTFPIYEYGRATLGAGSAAEAAAAMDTTVQGHLYSTVPIANAAATPKSNTSWSGEFVVEISAKRNAKGNSITVAGQEFYYPNGIAIPLSSLFGRDIYSPYTSVRVRSLIAQKGAATLTTATCFVAVHLVGTPL